MDVEVLLHRATPTQHTFDLAGLRVAACLIGPCRLDPSFDETGRVEDRTGHLRDSHVARQRNYGYPKRLLVVLHLVDTVGEP